MPATYQLTKRKKLIDPVHMTDPNATPHQMTANPALVSYIKGGVTSLTKYGHGHILTPLLTWPDVSNHVSQ